jgi:NAD(P)H dehydrogenase (quinone)
VKNISIIYYSGRGHTKKIAEAVNAGASSVPDVRTTLIGIDEKDIVNGHYKNDAIISTLDASDAIIFGSPTYMGGVAAQFKAFADASISSWVQQKWRDKLAAGFTVSGTPSGDKFSTLQYFQTLAMQHGMLWISLGETPMQANGVNRLGSWSGAMAQAGNDSPEITPGAEDKLTAELLGKRVASFTVNLHS